jgi:hypothetical protein
MTTKRKRTVKQPKEAMWTMDQFVEFVYRSLADMEARLRAIEAVDMDPKTRVAINAALLSQSLKVRP